MVAPAIGIQALILVVCWRLVVRLDREADARRRELEDALTASRAERETIDRIRTEP